MLLGIFALAHSFLESSFPHICRISSSLFREIFLKCSLISEVFPDVLLKNLYPPTLHSISVFLIYFFFLQIILLTFYMFLLLLSIVHLLPLEHKLHGRNNFRLCCSMLFPEHLKQCRHILGTYILLKCFNELEQTCILKQGAVVPGLKSGSLILDCALLLHCNSEITFSSSPP